MNEKLVITSTLSHIDSSPPRTTSEWYFALEVCLHLSCKNSSQNANMSDLWSIFESGWKITRKTSGHYRIERWKNGAELFHIITPINHSTVHRRHLSRPVCRWAWNAIAYRKESKRLCHDLTLSFLSFMRCLLKLVLARIEELWFMPRSVAWSVFFSHERDDMTNIP